MSTVIYKSKEYDFDGNNKYINHEGYKFMYPLEFNNITQLTDDNFIALKLLRTETQENKIYEVKLNRVRIGWLFPVSALVSDEHDFSENEHFLNYTKAAVCMLIEEAIENKDYPLDEYELNNLEHHYEENTHILCVYKEKLHDVKLEQLSCSLLEHGFTSYTNKRIFWTSDYPEDGKINLKVIPQEFLEKYPVLLRFFNDFLPFIENRILRFFIYYQLIELTCMEVYFKENIAEKFKGLDSDISISELKDFIKNINDSISDKKRILKLYETYSAILLEQSFITDFTSVLLRNNIITEKTTHIATQVYILRNKIFHNFYNTSFNDKDFEIIDSFMFSFVTQALYTFKF